MSLILQPPSAQPVALDAAAYGLAEEEFANNAFHLLIVCIFLNKTPGERAIPRARAFLKRFDTPNALAKAKYEEVFPYFKPLGLYRRVQWVIDLARTWCEDPPRPHRIHVKRYKETCIRSEVAHLKGVGNYANDAWRIFCKDRLYGRENPDRPEWKKVTPTDKELIAYIKWKWAREGYEWSPETGLRCRTGLDGLTLKLRNLELNPKKSREPYLLPFPGGYVMIPRHIEDAAEVLK
ncbi:hypothetical protein VTN77DRAFT_7413 [Rasamsonia byssochlamydoides]|uniref:uncharacterized protein n=1 Tax=Rasamsonia byssochlamydoides TaxID=89139 RepID=UPI00374202FF